jgi:hypothetical protein
MKRQVESSVPPIYSDESSNQTRKQSTGDQKRKLCGLREKKIAAPGVRSILPREAQRRIRVVVGSKPKLYTMLGIIDDC